MLTNSHQPNFHKPNTNGEWFALVEEWENSNESQRWKDFEENSSCSNFEEYAGFYL